MKKAIGLICLTLMAGCATPQKADLSGSLRGVTFANGWGGVKPADYRCDVISCEAMEWILGGDLKTVQRAQIDRLVKVKADCDKAGKWLEIVLNTNDAENNQANATAARIDGLDYAKQKLGTDIIVQPGSETRPSAVNWTTVRQHANAIFPHVVQYGGCGVAGKPWTELHPQSVYDGRCGLPDAPASWIVTDCGPVMADSLTPAQARVLWKSCGKASFSVYGTKPSASYVNEVFK